MAACITHRLRDDRDTFFGRYQPDCDLKFPNFVNNPGFYRMIPEKRDNLVGIAGPWRTRIDYLWFPRQLVQGNRSVATCERMAHRKGSDELFIP